MENHCLVSSLRQQLNLAGAGETSDTCPCISMFPNGQALDRATQGAPAVYAHPPGSSIDFMTRILALPTTMMYL